MGLTDQMASPSPNSLTSTRAAELCVLCGQTQPGLAGQSCVESLSSPGLLGRGDETAWRLFTLSLVVLPWPGPLPSSPASLSTQVAGDQASGAGSFTLCLSPNSQEPALS